MGRYAEHVYSSQDDIARIETLAGTLPDQAVVDVRLDDGRHVRGTVSVRPMMQVFQDADENEGLNASVRIDDLENPAHAHYLWLDRIEHVQRLGSA